MDQWTRQATRRGKLRCFDADEVPDGTSGIGNCAKCSHFFMYRIWTCVEILSLRCKKRESSDDDRPT